MLNKEKYKEKIEQILVDGDVLAFDKKNNEIIPCCFLHRCSDCKFSFSADKECSENRREWLNSEYVEPEVDWSKIPVDTPILVRHNENQNWNKRYFAEYDHGIVRAWTCGRTSWNAGGGTLAWNYAKIAEDIKQPRNDGWHNLKDKKPEDTQEVLTWDGLGVQEDRWSDDADYFESTDAKEIWWRAMPEPPEV